MHTRAGSEGLWRFGAFELDARSRELRGAGTHVRLQEQPFEILRLMLERPGDVIGRDELRQRLWPDGTFVDFEHSLNAAVKRLRAALGDDADNPRSVETLPRRGYRFIAQVGPAPATAGAGAAGSSRSGSGTHLARVAILPFTNLSGDDAQYFSDGLTEELIAQLGQMCGSRIGVLARWSSMLFRGTTRRAREIGETLRADYLLEGSVRREGDRVRITARLVEAAGETHLWADSYERHLTDCLSVQADVAARIARSLTAELLPDHPGAAVRSRDAEAYQAYLKGRFHWNRPGDAGLAAAIAHFDQALAIDPRFAAAHASRARALIGQAEYYNDHPSVALEAARASALSALAIDASEWQAHVALGEVQRHLDWDRDAAEASYANAIAINPSSESAHGAYAMLLAALGRHPEAIREADRAHELDPLCLVVGTGAAWVRYAAGDYEGAVERCRHSIGMDATYGFSAARRLLGAAYVQMGRLDEAVAEMESALRDSAPEPVLMSWLAHAKGVSGDVAGASTLVAAVLADHGRRHLPSYHLALAHTGLGDHDAAFAALEQASTDRDPLVTNVGVEPRFEPLRSDVRYARLLARLHLRRGRARRGEAHSA